MDNRLSRWFFFTLFFAIFPWGAALILRSLNDMLSVEARANSPEMLFFVMIICATAARDLKEKASPSGSDTLDDVLGNLLLGGALAAVFLYGSLLQDLITQPERMTFRLTLLWVSYVMGVGFLILSTATQAMIARRERR